MMPSPLAPRFSPLTPLLLLLLFAADPLFAQAGGDPAQLLLSRARFHERLNETSEAIRFYEQAIPLLPEGDPRRLPHQLRLAGLHASLGRYEEAWKAYERVKDLPNFRDELTDRKAWHETLARTGRLDGEIEHLRVETAKRPVGDRAALELVDLYNNAGRRTEAVELVRKVADANRGDPFLMTRAAEMLQASGRLDEAIDLFRAASRTLGDDAQAIRKLALALLSAGRRDEAKRELRRALRDPDNPQEYIQLAELHQALALADEAIALLLEARGKFPHPTLFLIELGRAYEVALRFGEAANRYCEAIEAGRDYEGREALAELCRTEPQSLDEILAAVARRTVSDEPGAARRFYALLHDLSLDAARFPEALEYAERLAALGDPGALARFARAARLLARNDLAERARSRILALDPDGPLSLGVRLEQAAERRDRLEPRDRTLLELVAAGGPGVEQRVAALALFRDALAALRLNDALRWLEKFFTFGGAPADVALTGLTRVALDLARPDLARALLESPEREAGRNDIAEGSVLLFEGSVEAGLAALEETVLRAPLSPGAPEAVDLAFLARLAEGKELADYLARRTAAFAATDPAPLHPLADRSGEVALRAAVDAARIARGRGESADADALLLAAGRSGGTGADEAAFEALERLRDAGATAEVRLAARRFLADHPTSPRFRAVKEMTEK